MLNEILGAVIAERPSSAWASRRNDFAQTASAHTVVPTLQLLEIPGVAVFSLAEQTPETPVANP
jgi:hypothetical protein